MKREQSRLAAGVCRAVTASLLVSFLASCTSAGDQQFALQSPSLADGETPAEKALDMESDASVENAVSEDGGGSDNATPQAAAVPSGRPDDEAAARQATVEPDAPIQKASAATAFTAGNDESRTALASKPSGPNAIASATPPSLIDNKKRAYLSSFFGSESRATQRPMDEIKPLLPRNAPLGRPSKEASRTKPIIKLASAEGGELRSASAAFALDGDDNDLPGVRQTMLFEIKRKSGIDDESDVDVHEEDELGQFKVASAAGLARLAPNGLLKQRETVDTACLKPALVRSLKQAEAHFGKRLIITSGYRSPQYNRKVKGAERSMHMYCAAADIQMPGVSKWELANYFRAQPSRGGVGTYCSTNSIHVDVGPERDWNWKCGRRKG